MKAVRRAMLVALVVSLTALAPAAAQAATITGTVSGEDTHAGIGGVEVCPTPQPYTFEVACATTDSSGHYSLDDLPPAQYSIAFSGWVNNVPYVSEVYDNKPAYTYGDLVTLGSPDEVRQLDVEL
ncbi:MAG TPA: carboxypeptidase regulatory-like domain-containing protein, partial [Solirubrobacterales bacterium]|nr:carboxypeptidase regulatory-like domain-containing protein [Solirubrobacterales bacterium]